MRSLVYQGDAGELQSLAGEALESHFFAHNHTGRKAAAATPAWIRTAFSLIPQASVQSDHNPGGVAW